MREHLELHRIFPADRFDGDHQGWVLRDPLALLRLPATHDEYLKLVGDKTRNMIRKAEKLGYIYREFSWNEHLEEIFAINTSKEERSSGAMHGWYTKPVEPRHPAPAEAAHLKYYGAFKDGKLWAYLHLVMCGDFAFFKHFIGHGEHLKFGIMNGLISWSVREYIAHPQLRWLKYGNFTKETAQTPKAAFTRHAGFDLYATFLDLADDRELLEVAQDVSK